VTIALIAAVLKRTLGDIKCSRTNVGRSSSEMELTKTSTSGGKLADDTADLRRRAKKRKKKERKRKEEKGRRRRKKLDTKGALGKVKAGEVVTANVNHCMTDSIPVPA
jgi:hypothetical protein